MSNELQEGKKTPLDKPESLVGQVIDGYHIVQRIANSMVFLAFKEDDPGTRVAMKVFYPDPYACNHDEILERLHSIHGLDHENIVKLLAIGETEYFIYAVMEYVPGENLYDLMQRNPRLHWAAAAELAREIIHGLVAAHAKGATHRSLHPDRVLLGKGAQIKINFCNEGEITFSSEIANYVAPELFLGQPLEESSDIYSLGAIIYNIVTGKPPLAGKTPKEIALKHREMEPVLPNYGVADIPHSLSLILERSLNKDLQQRYCHSYELQAAIKNFLLNDIGSYKIGSYKELLPKVVEVSESGKAFDQALVMELDKRKKDEKVVVSLAIEDIKIETDTSEVVSSETEMGEEEKWYQKLYQKLAEVSFTKKAIAGCVLSLLANLILLLLLKK